MKKLNAVSYVIIALGIISLFITAVFFQFYTYEEDGKIRGDWRADESIMYLGTARFISLIAGGVITAGIIFFLISYEKSLRKQNIINILFIVLGVLTIIGSLNAFFPCTEMMRMNDRPMRCYWTMKNMLGIAGAVSISGALMLLFNRSKEFIKGMNCSVIILCCLYLLTPLKITGLCFSAMPCVERYHPFSLMMGCFMLVLSVLNSFLLYKSAKKKN